MELTERVEIIEKMMNESKKSLHQYSIYFLIWGFVMAPAGVAEYLLSGWEYSWIVWPIAGITGGIVSSIVGYIQGKKSKYATAVDRITGYTWGAFGFGLIFVIFYALHAGKPPHALILLLAGIATFISGGISKFSPFVWGGIALVLSAVACGFFVEPIYHSLIFAGGIVLGYIIPGFLLRNSEHEQA